MSTTKSSKIPRADELLTTKESDQLPNTFSEPAWWKEAVIFQVRRKLIKGRARRRAKASANDRSGQLVSATQTGTGSVTWEESFPRSTTSRRSVPMSSGLARFTSHQTSEYLLLPAYGIVHGLIDGGTCDPQQRHG